MDHTVPAVPKRMRFFSNWNTPLPGEEPDLERHAAYEDFVRRVAGEALPWLLPLLEESGASVLAGPGTFMFSLPSAPSSCWHHVPEIASHLNLLPWVEADEIAH